MLDSVQLFFMKTALRFKALSPNGKTCLVLSLMVLFVLLAELAVHYGHVNLHNPPGWGPD
jgi:hypothetical protein